MAHGYKGARMALATPLDTLSRQKTAYNGLPYHRLHKELPGQQGIVRSVDCVDRLSGWNARSVQCGM